MLAAERIRIRALLDLVSSKAVRFKASAAGVARLIDHASERDAKIWRLPMEYRCGFRQRDTVIPPQLLVDAKRRRQLFFDANGEWSIAARRNPGGSVFLFGREFDIVFLREGAGTRDFDG